MACLSNRVGFFYWYYKVKHEWDSENIHIFLLRPIGNEAALIVDLVSSEFKIGFFLLSSYAHIILLSKIVWLSCLQCKLYIPIENTLNYNSKQIDTENQTKIMLKNSYKNESKRKKKFNWKQK